MKRWRRRNAERALALARFPDRSVAHHGCGAYQSGYIAHGAAESDLVLVIPGPEFFKERLDLSHFTTRFKVDARTPKLRVFEGNNSSKSPQWRLSNRYRFLSHCLRATSYQPETRRMRQICLRQCLCQRLHQEQDIAAAQYLCFL